MNPDNYNKTGGPAFPLVYQPALKTSEGITVRDYFAAVALTGLLASYVNHADPEPTQAAKASYAYADAMLEARR